MTNPTTMDTSTGSAVGSTDPVSPQRRSALQTIILLYVWCGLFAGLLEVGALLVRKHFFDADRAVRLSHHFVWLIPVANLCIFIALAVIGSAVVFIWPHRGRWLFTRTLAAFTVLPPLLAAFPKIYTRSLAAGCGRNRRQDRSDHRTQLLAISSFLPCRIPSATRHRGYPRWFCVVSRSLQTGR